MIRGAASVLVALGALLPVSAAGQAGASSVFDSDRTRAAGLISRIEATGYTPAWFAGRYGVAAPSVDSRPFGSLWGAAVIQSIVAASPADRRSLWTGLSKDLGPDSVLLSHGDAIVWILAGGPEPLRHARQAVESDPPGTVSTTHDLDWLSSEIPPRLPGLGPSYRMTMTNLPERERMVGGIALRAVVQENRLLDSARLPAKLSQATFWVPRVAGDAGRLAKALDLQRSPGQVVMTGKGVAVVVLAMQPAGMSAMTGYLASRGYEILSPPSWPDPVATPAAPLVSRP